MHNVVHDEKLNIEVDRIFIPSSSTVDWNPSSGIPFMFQFRSGKGTLHDFVISHLK